MALHPEHEIALATSIAFFTSHPWTALLLKDRSLSLPGSLVPKISKEDSLFALSLPHPSRLTHCLVLTDTITPTPSPHSQSPGSLADPTRKQAKGIDTLTVLFALGDALNGFPQMLHGGITCVLLDEAAGILLTTDAAARSAPLGLFTSRLEIEYKAPITTPGIIAVEIRISARKGRSVILEGVIRQEGKLCAKGDVVYKLPRGLL